MSGSGVWSARRRVALVSLLVGVAALVALTVWRVPWDPAGGPFRLPAPDTVLDPQQIARGEQYAGWARVWSLCSLLVSMLLAVVLGLTRRGRGVVDRVLGGHRDGRSARWWRVVLWVAAQVLLGRLITLPFAVLLRRRQRSFGLTEQSWSGFAADVARTEVLQVVVTALAVLLILGLARRVPRAWPAVAGLVLAGLVMAGSLVYPLVVEPVFNRFTPLPDGPLRTQVLRLADREGVRIDDVLVADASRRTTTLNAYVSGLAGTRRVVLYDTLVDDVAPDEVLSVVAHELTHARDDDVLTGSSLGAAGAVAGAGLLGLVLPAGFAGVVSGGSGGTRRATRAPSPGEVAQLLALAAVALTFITPAQNAISRRIETRADIGALRATHDAAAFEALQAQLAARSLADLTPPPAWQWWFGSHPTTLERVALARRAD